MLNRFQSVKKSALFLLILVLMLAATVISVSAESLTARSSLMSMEVVPIEGNHTGSDPISMKVTCKAKSYDLTSVTLNATLPEGFSFADGVTFPTEVGPIAKLGAKENTYSIVRTGTSETTATATDAVETKGGCGSVATGAIVALLLVGIALLSVPAKKKIAMLVLIALCVPLCLASFTVGSAADDMFVDLQVPFTYDGVEYTCTLHADFVQIEYALPTYSAYHEPEYEKVENADFYVSVNGNDNNPGTKEQPFATFEKAKQAVNQLKTTKTDGITVAVMAGRYFDNAISLGKEDGGSENGLITWCKYGDGEVILDGGIDLTAENMSPLSESEKSLFRADAVDNIVKVDLGAMNLTANGGMVLYDGAERCFTARYPNVDENRRDVFVTENSPVSSMDHTVLIEEDLVQRLSSYHTFEGVDVNGYLKWDWYNDHVNIANLDTEKRFLTFTSSLGISDYAKFFFENVTEELDAAGEYFLDTANNVLYLYRSDSSNFHLALGYGSRISVDTSYVSFVGFTIRACGGGADGVGDYITFDQCHIYDIDGKGVYLNGYHNNVTRCEIDHVGYDCVTINGGDHGTLTLSESKVDNCSLHDFGLVQKTYEGAIRIEGAVGITISHNEMFNGPHLAFHGWGNELIFEYNVIHDVVLQSNDAGAYYAGRTWTNYGNIQRYNLFYNISGNGYSGNALYWDDGLSGQTAYGNIFFNVAGKGLLAGGGHDNVINGNLFVNCTISFDDRFTEALTTKSGAYYEFVNGENSILWSDYITHIDNEIWNEKYPDMFKYNDVSQWNNYMYNSSNPANPVRNVITNNVIVAYGMDIAGIVSQMGTVSNNVIFSNKSNGGFVNPNAGDYSIAEGDTSINKTCSDLSFPTSEMGRY